MASSKSETRTCHPSAEQVEALVSFLESRLDIASGFGKNQARRINTKQEWLKIGLKLNNIPGGTVKTTQRWIKYWSDKKSSVKKKAAILEKCTDNVSELPELSDIEERILAIIKKYDSTPRSLLYRQMKTEPIEPQQNENSRDNIEAAFLLEEEMGGEEEVQTDSPNEESEDAFLSTYRLNDSSKSNSRDENNHTSHTPSVSSLRWGRIKLPKPSEPPPHPSAQTNFFLVADKLCRIEQQRLELDRRMMDVMERNSDRDHMLAEAVKAMGEGLKALADAIARN